MKATIRAKSTIKLANKDSGVDTTWGFVKGTPLLSVITDLLQFSGEVDVAAVRKHINEVLDEIEERQS